MTQAEVSFALAKLPTAHKAGFLALFAHELTSVGRSTYATAGPGLAQPTRLRELNEASHNVTAVLAALLRDDPRRYPDDVIAALVCANSRDPEVNRLIGVAWVQAIEHLGVGA